MWGLVLPVAFLSTLSLAVISSISGHLFILQLSWMLIGACIIIVFFFIDWRTILNYRWFVQILYGLGLLLLVFVYFKGPVIKNTRSWLVLGPFTFQPVELIKISLILLYARFFSRRHIEIARFKTIITTFIYFIIPTALVALLPDLGSASVLFVIWFGMLIVSGLPLRRIILAIGIFIILGVIGWSAVLKDYQRERIVGVFYPEQNALSINYSLNQAKIAIGSAGFFGKGYGQGTQTQLGFLTEPGTDFILAAVIEEWGMLGGLLAIGAFLSLIFAILKVSIRADHNFEKLICLGAILVFVWQFFLNVGSTVGLSPVVGLTFPFLSYGGSSLLINFSLLGIIIGVAKRS